MLEFQEKKLKKWLDIVRKNIGWTSDNKQVWKGKSSCSNKTSNNTAIYIHIYIQVMHTAQVYLLYRKTTDTSCTPITLGNRLNSFESEIQNHELDN